MNFFSEIWAELIIRALLEPARKLVSCKIIVLTLFLCEPRPNLLLITVDTADLVSILLIFNMYLCISYLLIATLSG